MDKRIKNFIQPGDGDPRHGDYSSYINHGCRCDECKKANREWQAKRRVQRYRQDPPVHGTPGSYTNWGCRCDECRSAHATARREYLKRKKSS